MSGWSRQREKKVLCDLCYFAIIIYVPFSLAAVMYLFRSFTIPTIYIVVAIVCVYIRVRSFSAQDNFIVIDISGHAFVY